jgi:hypothetical protein
LLASKTLYLPALRPLHDAPTHSPRRPPLF